MKYDYPNSEILVSPEWVKDHLEKSDLVIVDTPWKAEAYPRAHLPGARCRPGHSYLKGTNEEGEKGLHVMDGDEFVQLMADLGIRQSDQVVVYDDFHCLFATRFWWVCRHYGFDRVKVMNGGWQAWVERAYPISIEIPEVEKGTDIEVRESEDSLLSMEDFLDLHQADACVTWDTRSKAEFTGEDQKGNLRGGHVPGARHVEWKDMLQVEEKPGGSRPMRSKEDLAGLLAEAKLEPDDLVVTHCQAGIRGAFGSFVLELMGYSNHRLYDASMAEWADQEHTPLEVPD